MARRLYLFSYDVADDRRRDAVFKTLRDQGDHVQYSVFFCELNGRELASLKARLDDLVHHDDDQVLILDLGNETNPLDGLLETVGRPYRPPVRVRVI